MNALILANMFSDDDDVEELHLRDTVSIDRCCDLSHTYLGCR